VARIESAFAVPGVKRLFRDLLAVHVRAENKASHGVEHEESSSPCLAGVSIGQQIFGLHSKSAVSFVAVCQLVVGERRVVIDCPFLFDFVRSFRV